MPQMSRSSNASAALKSVSRTTTAMPAAPRSREWKAKRNNFIVHSLLLHHIYITTQHHHEHDDRKKEAHLPVSHQCHSLQWIRGKWIRQRTGPAYPGFSIQ